MIGIVLTLFGFTTMDIDTSDNNTPNEPARSPVRKGIVVAILVMGLLAAVAWKLLKDADRERVDLERKAQIEAEATPQVDSASTVKASENLPTSYRTVPFDEKLTERSGRSMKLEALKGKIWVADFIFTRCAGPCPMISRKMVDLQAALQKATNVKLVTFTVDPEYDNPERLSVYADEFGADKEKWLFLTTGSKPKMWDLAMKGFGLAAGEDTVRATGQKVIYHEERFMVVDGAGNIRGYFDSKDREFQPKILTRIGALLREQGGGSGI